MKRIFALSLSVLLLFSVFSIYSSAEGEPSPIAWYSFEDQSALGYDKTGSGNDMTAAGNVVQSAGKSGNGVYFDGSSALYASTDENGFDYVDLIDSTTKQMTIMYWIQYDISDFDEFDISSWRRAVSNGADGSCGNGGFLMLSLLDNYVVPTQINPTIVFSLDSNSVFTRANWSTYAYTEDWTHIAWTIDTATGHSLFYVNGTCIFDLVTTEADGGPFVLANALRPFAIGSDYFSDNGSDVFFQSYTGDMDEFAVFDTVLTPDQIQYYMQNGYIPSAPETDAPETDAPETAAPETDVPGTDKPNDNPVTSDGVAIAISACLLCVTGISAALCLKRRIK